MLLTPHRFAGFVLAGLLASASSAQEARTSDTDDPMERPTESGVRLTPTMARAMGNVYAHQVMTRRYELEESKADAVAELVARRIMESAHKTEEQGQDFFEFMMTQVLSEQAESKRTGAGRGGISPHMARGVAERVTPMLPMIRELIGGVVQDVRPMLPLKQQIRYSADALMATTAMDSFEKTMQRWSKGDVNPFEDPFSSENPQVVRDQNGESVAVRQAKKAAEAVTAVEPWVDWQSYVEDAKKFYAFDASQAASADSILREYIERARTAAQDATYRDKLYRNRLWSNLSHLLPGGWNNPIRTRLQSEFEHLQEPFSKLFSELKEGVDELPTIAQREAAEERVNAALAASIGEQPSAGAAAPVATEGR